MMWPAPPLVTLFVGTMRRRRAPPPNFISGADLASMATLSAPWVSGPLVRPAGDGGEEDSAGDEDDNDGGRGNPLRRSQVIVYQSPPPWATTPTPIDAAGLRIRLIEMEHVDALVADMTLLSMIVQRHPDAAAVVMGPAPAPTNRPLPSAVEAMEQWPSLSTTMRHAIWHAAVEAVFPGGQLPEPNRSPRAGDMVAVASSIDPPTVEEDESDNTVHDRYNCVFDGDRPHMQWHVEVSRPFTPPAPAPLPPPTIADPAPAPSDPMILSMPDLVVLKAPTAKRSRDLAEQGDAPPVAAATATASAATARPTKRANTGQQPPLPQSLQCPERVTFIVDRAPESHYFVRTPMFQMLCDSTTRIFEQNQIYSLMLQDPLDRACRIPGTQKRLTDLERVRFYTQLRDMAKKQGVSKGVSFTSVALQFFGNPQYKDTASEYQNRLTHFWGAITFLQLFVVPGPLDAPRLLDVSPWLAFSLLNVAGEPALRAWLSAHRQDPHYFPSLAAAPSINVSGGASADSSTERKKLDFRALLSSSSTLSAPASYVATAPSSSAVVEEEVVEVETVLSLHPPAVLPLGPGDNAGVNNHAIVAFLLRNPGLDQAEFRKSHGAKMYDLTRPCSRLDMESTGEAYLKWCASASVSLTHLGSSNKTRVALQSRSSPSTFGSTCSSCSSRASPTRRASPQ
jgi:hypothetical protein